MNRMKCAVECVKLLFTIFTRDSFLLKGRKKLNEYIHGFRNIYCYRQFNRKGLYSIITFFSIGETTYTYFFLATIFHAIIYLLKFGRYKYRESNSESNYKISWASDRHCTVTIHSFSSKLNSLLQWNFLIGSSLWLDQLELIFLSLIF